jgi:DNA-binding NtrC family response regulator
MAEEGEGIVLARWLGEHYPRIPVLLTSGSQGVARARAWETSANVTDFVPKPYSLGTIERLIRTRIASRDISPK